MSIERLLRNEIQSEIEELGKTEVGSDQYKATVDGITKLTDRVIEMERLDLEIQEKEASRETEADLKLKQMAEDRKGRIVRDVLTAVGIVVPTVVTVWGALKSWEFEKEGTVTTMMGRGFINKLLPKK